MARRIYSPELRRAAIRLLIEKNYSVKRAAEKLGVAAYTLYYWRNLHRKNNGALNSTEEKDREKRNEILTRGLAIIQIHFYGDLDNSKPNYNQLDSYSGSVKIPKQNSFAADACIELWQQAMEFKAPGNILAMVLPAELKAELSKLIDSYIEFTNPELVSDSMCKGYLKDIVIQIEQGRIPLRKSLKSPLPSIKYSARKLKDPGQRRRVLDLLAKIKK